MAIDLVKRSDQVLQSEVRRLRKELTQTSALLESERKKTSELESILETAVAVGTVPSDDPFELEEDDDELSRAFDSFINQPDPDHDKIRGFLLG